MRAILDGTVVAEADDADVIEIEGNSYFPPSATDGDRFEKSPTPYFCPWKGECQYWSIRVGDRLYGDAAWSYPEPMPTALERVGRDFGGYVAFDPSVRVE
ncbi:uncharacterized protein (DUF427 family) [Stackebrandtia albiflava]|uniref:Uncharacterized protein (DUF427 family) n=1 Tax=Stackebrandtia albiflava TaxID=406432 RepID=A0A562V9Y6_9ACTN|nr:DUF427 domain-containing protein [Stackebrandtia albiflava]TWJ14696.1 uncharacterized protein (DUF427 family) [Stackebrandtia albiflava]